LNVSGLSTTTGEPSPRVGSSPAWPPRRCVPAPAALNGPVAASVVHTAADHLLEGTGLSPATTDVTAERL
jgi:hypothetical protein